MFMVKRLSGNRQLLILKREKREEKKREEKREKVRTLKL
jgi:hypothetical protein